MPFVEGEILGGKEPDGSARSNRRSVSFRKAATPAAAESAIKCRRETMADSTGVEGMDSSLGAAR
ncbi:hypothetical protein OP10G_2480 [Fimbriimonas ginsengisoli Gsoil 348]|uniref:Uncharacterized protein n=1 Tax=Fimbriimonas ginsengisoli Gsoil 348 TaxID=661478 RepID=A0A068NQL0_FIMGI|nr:hypothetical protein [Fimbriimonas ginsengisoli]AIE85848.1 hypothetical protein OP10G_2480 [Fimbriimonas ginsengisoli Gsoil 348]